MKICHIVHRYNPVFGGAERYMQELSESFVARGHSVDLLTTNAKDISYFWNPRRLKANAPEQEEIRGVNVHRLPIRHLPAHRYLTKGLSVLPLLRRKYAPHYPWIPRLACLIKNAKAGDYDIVHATAFPYMSIMYYAKQLAEKINRPLIVTPFIHLGEPHNKEISRHFASREQLAFLGRCSRVVVHTSMERDFMLEKGLDPTKLALIGLGIDLQQIDGGQGEKFRKSFDIDEDTSLIGFIGTKSYDKGVLHLLESYIQLRKSGHNLRLVLVGQPVEDFLTAYSTLPIHSTNQIINLYNITEESKLHLLDALDIFAMPSRMDSFGLVFLESWAYGKPVIGARAGGVLEVIQDGYNGFLVPFGDVGLLTVRIEELLQDPERAKQMGANGRRTVEERYTMEKKFPILETLYASLVSQSGQELGLETLGQTS
jgi:glycosyltransferase involved in cell wall biosynthesis